jgi:hypothetical protein
LLSKQAEKKTRAKTHSGKGAKKRGTVFDIDPARATEYTRKLNTSGIRVAIPIRFLRGE